MQTTDQSDALVPTPTLTDRLWGAVLDEILSGTYRVGDLLPSEQMLSQRFGVSRTVVREAVSRLKAEGFIAARQGLGVIVIANRKKPILQFDISELDKADSVTRLTEIRIGLESEAAGLAAERRTKADLKAMLDFLDTMKHSIDQGRTDAGVEADVGFHHAVFVATANPHYVALNSFLDQHMRSNIALSRRNSALSTDRGAKAQAEHRTIFDAIKARDAEGARAAARIHVENTRYRLVGAAPEMRVRRSSISQKADDQSRFVRSNAFHGQR